MRSRQDASCAGTVFLFALIVSLIGADAFQFSILLSACAFKITRVKFNDVKGR